MALELSNLKPHRGARHRKKIVGRGEASGHGKTSTRGGKGQTARKGAPIKLRFEGGQTPLYRRVPKLGFRSRQKTRGDNRFSVINVRDLNRFADGETVNRESLERVGLSVQSWTKAGVKLLGVGDLKVKNLTIQVEAVSASAKAKVEAVGGKVEVIAQ